VLGEPGVGKSRVVRECVSAVSGRAHVLVGRCLPYGEGINEAHRLRTELGPVDEHAREIAARARERLGAAGERAFSRGDMPAAANLLERAADLFERADPARIDLLPLLGGAVVELGRLERAADVLDEAIAGARSAGDDMVEWRGSLERSALRAWMGGSMREAVSNAERAIGAFERLGDEGGLARAWLFVGKGRFWLGRAEAAHQAWERAVECAHAAGDRRAECEAVSWIPAALLLGPTPVQEAIHVCDELLRSDLRDRKVEAFALLHRASLEGMRGAFGEARRLLVEKQGDPARARAENRGGGCVADGLRRRDAGRQSGTCGG
jgi:tetratricopeptide (TPR) repeat protein